MNKTAGGGNNIITGCEMKAPTHFTFGTPKIKLNTYPPLFIRTVEIPADRVS